MSEDREKAWRAIFFPRLTIDGDGHVANLAARYRNFVRPNPSPTVFNGFFHACFLFSFPDDGPDLILRFPLWWKVLDVREHTRKEVAILTFLASETSIPIPRMIAYDLGESDDEPLAPFIVSEYVRGAPLSTIMKLEETGEKGEGRMSQLPEAILEKIYRQISNTLLELTSLDFGEIGALSMEGGEKRHWHVKYPPWTRTAHEAQRVYKIPLPGVQGPLLTVDDFYTYIADHVERCVEDEIKVDPDQEDVLCGNLHRFKELMLTPDFISRDSHAKQFKLHCDDLRPHNILINTSYEVVALVDWEFTYVAPAEYQCCLASWLIVSEPWSWTDADVDSYKNHLALFVRILQEEEDLRAQKGESETLRCTKLSDELLNGFSNGTFWFVLLARHGLNFSSLWERFAKFHLDA